MMPGLSLSELVARGVPARIAGDASTVVSGVTRDSRTVKPGDLFAALPGAKADGLTFVAEAKERGAVAVLAARAFDGGLPTSSPTTPVSRSRSPRSASTAIRPRRSRSWASRAPTARPRARGSSSRS